MEELLIITGILSIYGFVLNGAEKARTKSGKAPYSTLLMAITGVIAPFGSLMGMLLFGNRLKQTFMVIFVPLMLILYVLGVYLLRGSIS